MTTTPEAPAWRLTDSGRFRTVKVGGWTVEESDDLTPEGATRQPVRFWGPENRHGETVFEGVEAARAAALALLEACDYAERHLGD